MCAVPQCERIEIGVTHGTDRRLHQGRVAATVASTGEALSGAFNQRLKQIEKAQQGLEKKLKGLVDNLTKLFR